MNDKSSQSEPIGDPTKISMRVESIVAVIQRSGSFELRFEHLGSDAPEIRIENVLGPSSDPVIESNHLQATLDFRLDGWVDLPQEGSSELAPTRVLSVSGQFVVIYSLAHSVDETTKEDARAFVEVNGRMTTVPYWREYVHNSLARMGLPPYEVPVFNPFKLMQDAASLKKRVDKEAD